MRITIKIDDALLAEAESRAAGSGCTVDSVVEDALRESFARRDAEQLQRARLPVSKGSRVRPGVNLDDSAALLERMEPANHLPE